MNFLVDPMQGATDGGASPAPDPRFCIIFVGHCEEFDGGCGLYLCPELCAFLSS